MASAAVRFDNVGKRFRLGNTHDSLAEVLLRGWRRVAGRAPVADGRSAFWALRGLDFAVERGEALGIIGPNGSGKSTALKLAAGILRADRGSVRVDGRLASLIEVGAGFHGDLTGRENVFLNGAILGMRRPEVRAKLDDIVAFAGLARFLDTPVKRYSSGMYARLGFSIAAHVRPDILLVDEVLSVGDAVFRVRCEQRMRELVAGGTALVFVTHNLEQMRAICSRAIVLEEGSPTFEGPSCDAINQYMAAMSRAYAEQPTDLCGAGGGAGPVESVEIVFARDTGDQAVWIRASEPVRAEVRLTLSRPVPRLCVELAARVSAGENVLCFNSARSGEAFKCPAGDSSIALHVPALPLAGGRYFWNVRIWDLDSDETIANTPFRFPLVVDDDGNATGRLCVPHRWTRTAMHACKAVDDVNVTDGPASLHGATV
ncbi:MAG: polysaccharide ABC transporter ATP-binding protein [Phycisphaerae bacterium]